MTCSQADIDYARREMLTIKAQVEFTRGRINIIESQGGDTKDARVLLGQMEKSRDRAAENLRLLREAAGVSAYQPRQAEVQ